MTSPDICEVTAERFPVLAVVQMCWPSVCKVHFNSGDYMRWIKDVLLETRVYCKCHRKGEEVMEGGRGKAGRHYYHGIQILHKFSTDLNKWSKSPTQQKMIENDYKRMELGCLVQQQNNYLTRVYLCCNLSEHRDFDITKRAASIFQPDFSSNLCILSVS